ncbi:hypothetical protein DX03_07045 [Stenotrophomonas rhizophila]|nr:hypothetical protein DX03_07045 [Stenotrophomonas rhizophila]
MHFTIKILKPAGKSFELKTLDCAPFDRRPTNIIVETFSVMKYIRHFNRVTQQQHGTQQTLTE